MSKVTLDAVAAAKLREPGCTVEVRDENGRVIGRFRPETVGAWGPFTAAKSRPDGGRTLAEIEREFCRRLGEL